MGFDASSAAMIGGALTMLISRIVLALVRRYSVEVARTQHWSEAAREKHFAFPGIARLQSLGQSMPTRLKIGLMLGLAGFTVPILSTKLSSYVSGNAAGNALVVAGKWVIIGGIMQYARGFGVQRLAGMRRTVADKN